MSHIFVVFLHSILSEYKCFFVLYRIDILCGHSACLIHGKNVEHHLKTQITSEESASCLFHHIGHQNYVGAENVKIKCSFLKTSYLWFLKSAFDFVAI